VVSNYFSSEWQPATDPRQPLPVALDLPSLYEQLLRRLLPQPSHQREPIKDQVERLAQWNSKQSEYQKLLARLNKEKQFNRKVEINAELRRINEELAKLSTSPCKPIAHWRRS
jgi:DNA repair exonuclease SbcCD ATPase subunit